MQEKPLMAQLQSAYPNKFHNQFIIFFSTNFVPFHLKETTQSTTHIVQISSCHIFITIKSPWQHSKPLMTTFRENTKFSRKEFIRPNSCENPGLDQIMTTFPRKTRNSPDKNLFGHITAKSMDLTKIARISCISRFQRPIPTPPQTKNLQLVEFWPTLALAHS